MVRITADLLARSPQYFNAVREREVDLRGNKIAVIENLGATEDLFDSIDLSDNEIVKLEGFPLLKRLTTLLVNNNRVARIGANIGATLPKLETLVITNNKLVNLGDLESLATLPRLQTLSLLDNEVTKKPQYRLYLVHKLPKLRVLDFKKIRQKERDEAAKVFGGKEGEIALIKAAAKTFTPGEVVEPVAEKPVEEPKKAGPTPEQITAIKAAIASAQTLEEVSRLEKALMEGVMPSDIRLDGDELPGMETREADANGSKTGGAADTGAERMEEG